MELAAVVVVPGQKDFAFQDSHHISFTSTLSPAIHSSLSPVLGNDVLRMWTERIHKLGVPLLWAKAQDDIEMSSTLGKLGQQGVERLLMIKLKSYAEMDLSDLIHFHCLKRNSVTEVYDSRGRLGVCVFDQAALWASAEKISDCSIPEDVERTLYPFHGYAKRILSATERQELVKDALTGACAMRPLGKEIRDQLWVGEGVQLADSARVSGPTYIGDRTIIGPGATIGPFASVERDCFVDCGTTVERSTVLPSTYLASGILVRHALVDGGYLEDLRCGAVADLLPSGLAGRRKLTDHRAIDEPVVDVLTRTGTIASCLAPESTEWREMRL